MTVTIDASVWVAARFESEPGHSESAACLLEAIGSREPIVMPWLAWVECVAAVARKTHDEVLAHQMGMHLRDLASVRWVPLDETAAASATDVASSCRLRAADAIYAAVAGMHRAPLVTLDAEMRDRCGQQIRCLSPAEWVEGRAR